MATDAPHRFITLDEIIKSALTDLGEDSPHLYARFKTFILRGLNELQYDVLNDTKQKYLPVDAATKTAALPHDFVQWTRVGVITQGNEIQDLAHDPNLVYTPIEEEGCNPITEHCSCGCSDPLCAAISNATTTTEDVVINGVTYQKTTTVCTNDAGTIIGRICEPVVTNPERECTYSINTNSIQYPIKDAYFTKNGQVVNVGYVEDFDTMYEIMLALGFSATGFIPPYHRENCPDVWSTLTYTGTNTSEGENYDYNEVFVINVTQSSCVQPTPTVSTVCYDTILCATPETKSCGCPVLNNEVVNTIQQWSTLFMEFIQRDLHGMDWQKAMKQPLSWFGYFNVFPNLGVIQLDEHYPFDTVYLQYYTANEADGGLFQVPVMAQEALAAYIKFKYTFNKTNVSGFDKKLYQKAWYNEKKKLHQRNNPFRFAGYLDVQRMMPRP
jgi:hypothetical protein